jgi:hypothetical protein
MDGVPGAYNTWTGAHLIGYRLATGEFRDYGVVHPNYTSYAGIGVDSVRDLIYVFVTGELSGQISYVYRIHAVTGAKTRVDIPAFANPTFGTSLWFFIDRRGDVWFSLYGDGGSLRRIRPASAIAEKYDNVLPPRYKWNVEQIEPPGDRAIAWMKPIDGDRAVFTLGLPGGMLYQFDSTKDILSGQAFRTLRHIGYTDLGLALGNNRVFYYQRANRGCGHQADGQYTGICGPPPAGGVKDFHLLSVSLNPADGYAIVDHGLLTDDKGRKLWRAPGMATDGNSRVFLIGDWYTVAGDLGSCRFSLGGSETCGGLASYYQAPRGEFFAVATIPTAPGLGGYGDSNGDGRFDMADLNTLVDHLLVRQVIPAGSPAFVNTDVDGDGNLAMPDLNLYVDCLLRRIDSFPVQPGTGFCANAAVLGKPVVANNAVSMTKPLTTETDTAARTFSITGSFRNVSGAVQVGPFFKVTTLQGSACPCTVVGYGGVGAEIPVANAILPGGEFTRKFSIQLTRTGPQYSVAFYANFMKY